MSDHSFATAVDEIRSRTPETIERQRCVRSVLRRNFLNGLMSNATDALDCALAGDPDFRAYIAKRFTEFPEVYQLNHAPDKRGMTISSVKDMEGSNGSIAIYIVQGAGKPFIEMFEYVPMNPGGPLVVAGEAQVGSALENKLASIDTPYALMLACLEVLGLPDPHLAVSV